MSPFATANRLTALCFGYICIGYYRSANHTMTWAGNMTSLPRQSPKGASPEALRSAVAATSTLVVLCLIIVVVLVLSEAGRTAVMSRRTARRRIASVYACATAKGPLRFPTERTTCSVCLEALSMLTVGRELPCGHLFHVGCIDKWMVQSASRPPYHIRCPLCNTTVVEAGITETRFRIDSTDMADALMASAHAPHPLDGSV